MKALILLAALFGTSLAQSSSATSAPTASAVSYSPSLVYMAAPAPSSTVTSYMTAFDSASPSMEVCLTKIFDHIAASLSAVQVSIKGEAAKVQYQMKHEYHGLSEELSDVKYAERAANYIYSAVDIDVYGLGEQIHLVESETYYVRLLYNEIKYQVACIESDIAEIRYDKIEIYQEFEKVQKEKLTLYSEMYTIQYIEKVIVSEEQQIQVVVAQLKNEVSYVMQIMDALYYRQEVLVEWEERLEADVQSLNDDVVKFRKLEGRLVIQESYLSAQESALLAELKVLLGQESALYALYHNLYAYERVLYGYGHELVQEQASFNADKETFLYAYSFFRGEMYELFYEACESSTSTSAV